MNRYYKILKQVPADYYSSGIKSNLLQRYWHNKKWGALNIFLKGCSGKLLDVGCADGTTSFKISQISPKLTVTGIDLYRETIEFAKQKYNQIEFITSNAQKLPFKNNSFDYICAIEILEHLEVPEIALAEIRRVLKPGGTLIIGQDTDSVLFKVVWWFWEKWKGSVWKNSHISCVRPEILIRRVKKGGFKIKRVIFINLGMEVFIKAEKSSNGIKRS